MSITEKVAHELNDADESILDELTSGRNLPQNLANELGYSRQYIQNRLQMLKAADYVENVGGGLYQLVDDPREDVDQEDDVEELKHHVRAAGEAIEAQDVDALRRHVRAACEVIGDD
jgi:biotin operon repressor